MLPTWCIRAISTCCLLWSYAVEVLEVKHIILCGHYGCGGIAAAVDGERHGIVDHWLQPIRDTAEGASPELAAIESESSRLNRLCELSIEAQVDNLARTPIISKCVEAGPDTQHSCLGLWA